MAPLGRLFFLLLAVPVCGLALGQEPGLLAVKRVVDGDTLILSNNERVRLIGVDTPEVHLTPKLRRDAARAGQDIAIIQAQGRKASAFTERIAGGQRVSLAFDEVNAARDHRDRYGRLLAYVYLVADAEEEGAPQTPEPGAGDLAAFHEGFLNALIIEAGYGHTYTRTPFEHKDRFLQFEKEARQTGRGLWAQ